MTTRPLSILVLAACLGALVSAFTAQYVFGLQPCNLCLIQRVPFALAALLAAAALAAGPRSSGILLTLAGALLVANGAIAVYHVGVEQHWWASLVCSGGDVAAIDVADLAAQMSRPAEVSCDRPQWSFHGITMAGLNVVYSTGLGALTLLLGRRMGGMA
ncbi:MAG: disulfide bond formation protein B [Actinomycetota bacterium]